MLPVKKISFESIIIDVSYSNSTSIVEIWIIEHIELFIFNQQILKLIFEEEDETFVNSLSEDSPQAEITSRRRYVYRFTIENSKKVTSITEVTL
jgi:hypothetical protein